MNAGRTGPGQWLQGGSGLLIVAAVSGLVAVGLIIWVLVQPSGGGTSNATGFEVSDIEVSGENKSTPYQPQVPAHNPDPVPPGLQAPAEVATFITNELLAGEGTDAKARLSFYPGDQVTRNSEGGEVATVLIDLVKWELEEFFQTYRERSFTSRGVVLESHDPTSDTMVLRQEYDSRLVRRDTGAIVQMREVRLVTVVQAGTSLRRVSGWQVVSCYHRYKARLSATDGASTTAPASEADAELALRAMLWKDRLNYAAGPTSQDYDDEPCPFLTQQDHLSKLNTATLSCFVGSASTAPTTAAALCQGPCLVDILVCDGSYSHDGGQPKVIVRKLSPP